MLYNTTHTNKETVRAIDQMVGKPYGFFESLKLKGTGSKRMIVDEVSPNLKSVINVVDDINYENIGKIKLTKMNGALDL